MTPVRVRLSSERSIDKSHRDILNAMQAALDAADPRKIIRQNVKLVHDGLQVRTIRLQLARFRRIFVIGAGKASGYMGDELERILGTRITGGLVIVPDYLQPIIRGRRIKYISGTHPFPSRQNLRGARAMLRLIEDHGPTDLVIVLVSGGASALMDLPAQGVTLKDERRLTSLLLKSGATIQEINIIRKHISQIKGGRLARFLKGSQVLTLVISDVIGDQLDSIGSGPTVPDSSTFKDAMGVLQKYNLWSQLPASIRDVIEKGLRGVLTETPKPGDLAFRRVNTLLIGSNRESCRAATRRLQKLGYRAMNVSTRLIGEARQVGEILSSMIGDVRDNGIPFPSPAALVFGGETTVVVRGSGKGGRNQELVLAAAIAMSGSANAVIASLATDGVDGGTRAAGAVADGTTVGRGRSAGLIAEEFLENNDSNGYFSKLGDLIETGPTGTNVNDIIIALTA